MTKSVDPVSHRVLAIDDSPAIHEDFRKILTGNGGSDAGLAAEEAALLGELAPESPYPRFELDCALQGQAGVELVRRYGEPAKHRHSMQIEINRKLYMDEATLELTPAHEDLKASLRSLARMLLETDPRRL